MMTRHDGERTRILALIVEALELPDGIITEDDQLIASVPGWDSIGWITIIGAIEDATGAELPYDRLADADTVGQVLDLVVAAIQEGA